MTQSMARPHKKFSDSQSIPTSLDGVDLIAEINGDGFGNLLYRRDAYHVAVVEKASFESACDFDTKVVQGVMWH
ncbi:hypothetical protein BY996DRAFT_6516321 [Phakopsora pachyrhizi]|nr:hypothetical protein BY996DRAFT_6516321 [Phakopsora pachyrhizi]